MLTAGLAAPALAQPVSRTDFPPPPSLTRLAQGTGGRPTAGVLCDLPSLPMAGLVDAAVAGVLGAPCGSSRTTGVASALPGLFPVSGAIPGLAVVVGVLPG
jgi:hypothetical protein